MPKLPSTALRLFGVDCDPAAVELARRTVAGAEIWCGDALFDPQLTKQSPFDAIVANPPYVNIRRLAKAQGAGYVQQLRGRFRAARGNFDLYVTFIERAVELLRVGGRCGMIVPNKWATLDYARPLRELLAREASLEQVIDLSAERVFAGASVYPQVLIFRKEQISAGKEAAPPMILRTPALDIESRVPTQPLGELVRLHCGTAGFAATKIARCLIDVGQASRLSEPQVEDPSHCDFITSGNIDRYHIRLGHVRFLGHTYAQPRLPLLSPELTDARRQLFREPKIVIAGLSKRIEAAWDEGGLALGVQVFAAAQWQVDPHALLAILNSKLLSYLFRTRFAAKRLAGDYLAVNKGQLAQLPIAVGQDLSCRSLAGQVLPYDPVADAEIDRRVYQLYQLTATEIDEVESHFAELTARAA